MSCRNVKTLRSYKDGGVLHGAKNSKWEGTGDDQYYCSLCFVRVQHSISLVFLHCYWKDISERYGHEREI